MMALVACGSSPSLQPSSSLALRSPTASSAVEAPPSESAEPSSSPTSAVPSAGTAWSSAALAVSGTAQPGDVAAALAVIRQYESALVRLSGRQHGPCWRRRHRRTVGLLPSLSTSELRSLQVRVTDTRSGLLHVILRPSRSGCLSAPRHPRIWDVPSSCGLIIPRSRTTTPAGASSWRRLIEPATGMSGNCVEEIAATPLAKTTITRSGSGQRVERRSGGHFAVTWSPQPARQD